jgi:transposase
MNNPGDLPGLETPAAAVGPAPPAVRLRPRVKPVDRSQMIWRSVDVERLIEEEHPARAIWALSGQLSLESFYAPIEATDGVAGRRPWDPRLLISMWVYAYSRGISSAREVSRRCQFEPAFQWLCGLEPVNHHTLSDFRVRHDGALKELFVQLLAVLSAEGLVSLERVMHDGTKIRADASRKSFRKEEALQAQLEEARAQVEQLSVEQDQESARHRAAQQRAVREREQKVQEALKQLEQIRQAKAGTEQKEQARASSSDPQARVMKQPGGGYAPSYNAQISTEASHKIVVGVEVTQQGNDYAQLMPAVAQIQENLNATPKQMVVDGGFTCRENIVNTDAAGIDLVGNLPQEGAMSAASLCRGDRRNEFSRADFQYDEAQNVFRCPAGQLLSATGQRKQCGALEHLYRAPAAACQACPLKAQCCPRTARRMLTRVEETAQVQRFRQKMQTAQAQEIYRQRAGVAEFPNAWLKEKLGLRRFRVRGLAKVRCEALWGCLTYNIQQWIRLCWLPKLAIVHSK